MLINVFEQTSTIGASYGDDLLRRIESIRDDEINNVETRLGGNLCSNNGNMETNVSKNAEGARDRERDEKGNVTGIMTGVKHIFKDTLHKAREVGGNAEDS